MKFTLSSLKKFLNTDASLEEIALKLTAIGLEVEDIIDNGESLRDFEVAYIAKTSKHESADKLQICEVQTKDGVLQIVCGASNARAGIKVVLAKVGTVIPSGKFKIKESEIRGVKSLGMLCSAEELMLGASSDGIIELAASAEIGESFVKHYGLDDPVIHINVTPNRGDALGSYGVARDLAASGIGTLIQPNILEIKPNFQSNFALEVKDNKACPLFAVREIKGLKNRQSPDWLQKFLNNIGIGSISAIVDVTNYICHVFGQPMHAYDADKLDGGLAIGLLETTANFAALNNKEYQLQPGDLVIRDKKQIHCVAGIIGSGQSAVVEGTTSIILESACFEALSISTTGRRLQIDTDSRYRFERNIDSSFTLKALDIATNMILEICGGQASQVIIKGQLAAQDKMEWPVASLAQVTGMNLSTEEITRILTALGFGPTLKGDNVMLQIPSWRHDIAIKEDIVEELARINGFDNIPEIPLPKAEISQLITGDQRKASDIKRILAGAGFDEVVTWSFTDSNQAKLFGEIKEELRLLNPISSDLDYMRPSILPNLLNSLRKNLARSLKDLALFEVGPVFSGLKPEDEVIFASGVRCGNDKPKNSHEPARPIDVFDIKADLEKILSFMGLSISKCQVLPITLPYYHPTRSASLNLGKNVIAYFGELHPQMLKAFEIETPVMAFELNIANIPQGKAKYGMRDEFVASDFQSNNRDFAFVVDKDQPAGEMISYLQNIDKKLIKSVQLFDIYAGDKLETGMKSVALSVQIQSDERTLTEEDLTVLSTQIVTAMAQKFNAKLRVAS